MVSTAFVHGFTSTAMLIMAIGAQNAFVLRQGLRREHVLPVVLVCASGARANRAVGIAKKLGYENDQALAGGLKAWREASLPVEKA